MFYIVTNSYSPNNDYANTLQRYKNSERQRSNYEIFLLTTFIYYNFGQDLAFSECKQSKPVFYSL